MSTIDIPLHAIIHILQLAEQRAATQETDELNEIIKSATAVNSGIAGRICEAFECVMERGDTIVVTATSIMNWTNEARTQKRQVVMEEIEIRRAWHFEKYSRRMNNLFFREQMNVSSYQLPSASDNGAPTIPGPLKMHTAIQSYPRAE